MYVFVMGHIGSDAGYWVFENGHWVHQGGWGIESMRDLVSAVNSMHEATQIKTPGVADAVGKSIMPFIEKELGAHIRGNGQGVVMIGAPAGAAAFAR